MQQNVYKCQLEGRLFFIFRLEDFVFLIDFAARQKFVVQICLFCVFGFHRSIWQLSNRSRGP